MAINVNMKQLCNYMLLSLSVSLRLLYLKLAWLKNKIISFEIGLNNIYFLTQYICIHEVTI